MEVFYAGAKAYFEYRSRADNPHTENTKERQQWEDGYNAAKSGAISELEARF